MKNNESTRAYSTNHENNVCSALSAVRQPNSGAGHWRKGDVVLKKASMLIECKCSMGIKSSFSIKKEWLDKLSEEKWTQRLSHSALCFNFEPDGDNYYIINETMMQFLVSKLCELDNDLI